MKICPKCHNKYTDATLNFCLQDGTQLIGGVSESGEHPTVSFEESETVVTNRPSEEVTQVRSTSDGRNWGESEVTRIATVQNEPKSSSSKTLLAVVLTALVMLVLFGGIGVGALLYYNWDDGSELAKSADNTNTADKNKNDKDNDGGIDFNRNANNPKSEKTPEIKPTPEKKTTPGKTAEPTPEDSPETSPSEIKKTIAAKIYAWKSLAESRSLGPYMNFYDVKLDYYTKRGVSKNFVRNDKRNAFNKYSTIKIQISNLSINPSKDGKTAAAVYDKEWYFSGSGAKQSGKVRSYLKFRKSGDRWLITSEKDLKVYYVNK